MQKRALLSVSDKTGICEFAQKLIDLGYEVISTGGTQKALEEAKIPVKGVEEVTDFPECFSGRVKTMHPLLLGGVLFRRDDKDHQNEAKKHGIEPIDVVVVNLYPFEETAKRSDASQQDIIEQIDIGGPTLLRSAAKNHDSVTVICDPADYDRVLQELESGDTSPELRSELATKVFLRTAAYDAAITAQLSGGTQEGLLMHKGMDLRYGENPHQWGKYFSIFRQENGCWHMHQGKELSYLNILDADGAWNLVNDFEEPTAACIKHANPSGVASNNDISEAFQRSFDADRLSAFGVIIALNRPCSKAIVEKIIEQKIFTEVIIAPKFDEDALKLLTEKPKVRAIECSCAQHEDHLVYRSALGGIIVQDSDTKTISADETKCVTDVQPTSDQMRDLLFAWKVVKHAKSNAIIFAKDSVTVGIGCGQTSRVDSTVIAARRADEKAKGAVMASDAFFPFPDSVEEAAKNGIAAIIQPGGSIRDEEVIAKANELKIPMVFTGVRAFRH